MPRLQHGGDLIFGKRREAWVNDALQALVQSTTSDGRHKIQREGFQKFQKWAKTTFRNPGLDAETQQPVFGIDFRTEEIRWMFDALGRYLEAEYALKPRLRAAHERMYDTSRKRG